MPSWNIHTAQVEQLLEEHIPSELGICDVNCFLFGNFLPDVYVGYMVPRVSKIIDYRTTHFADPYHMPEPDYQEFWQSYAESNRDGEGRVSDVVLGAWAHLVADHLYNHHVNELIVKQGLEYGDPLRIRKQSDFEHFGRTLFISMTPRVTPELIERCRAFPQYEVAEVDVRAAVEVACEMVEITQAHHIGSTPRYSLLDAAFFARVFDEVNATISAGLLAYAEGLL